MGCFFSCSTRKEEEESSPLKWSDDTVYHGVHNRRYVFGRPKPNVTFSFNKNLNALIKEHDQKKV